MTNDAAAGFLDLFEFPDSQRDILLYLTRNGPVDAASLADGTGLTPSDVHQALNALIEKGRVRLSPDGQADAVVGRVRGRTTLPAQLWQALLSTDRLYSEKDIAILRTAMPILQLARARLIEFADHGPGHALRVKSFANQLGYLISLNEAEQRLLRTAALFHDVGNIVDRDNHNVVSQETILRLTANGALPFDTREAEIVGLICRWHRGEYDPLRCDEWNGEIIRTGLLCSVLRVADAMDIDHRRSDYSHRFSSVIRFFYPEKLPYWTSLEEILGVRLHCAPSVRLQIFTRDDVKDNMQIAMLRDDLNSTPLGWSLEEIALAGRTSNDFRPGCEGEKGKGSALLVFPFDPHSVVMAALSRKHLTSVGHNVEVLCYPDTSGGAGWLWSQILQEMAPKNYSRLIVIGDRPDSSITTLLFETVSHWQSAGVAVSWLNRHEANWTRLPTFLQQGVEVVLGGDWTFFWGEPTSQNDLAWGRIAALCTRDPTQSTVGLTDEERAVTQGLLRAVYDAACQPAGDVDDWAALARPILDRIQVDDRGYFSDQAAGFASTYAVRVEPTRVEGRALLFEKMPGQFPQSCYWALESAIERYGHMPERGICFNTPYAIATWKDGDMVELLAINHWREEEAVPIRLLYPTNLGPPPAGNESTVQVRLTAAQAPSVIRALLDACNGSGLPFGAD